MIQQIILFTSIFASFSLLRCVHWILVKDIFYKYILLDSLIFSWLFILIPLILSLFFNLKEPNPWEQALYFLFMFVILPVLYNTVKGWFIVKKHPKLKNEYYPIVEFLIYILWIICWLAGSNIIISKFIG